MLDLNFNDKEENNSKFIKRSMPTEFTQCVVFYGTPIADELDNWDNGKGVPKKLKDELSKQKFVFPYYSSQIFMNPKDAEKFIPSFIRQLINEGKLPDDVLKKDDLVDETKIKAGLVHLDVSVIEKVD